MRGHSSKYPPGIGDGAFFKETENYKQCKTEPLSLHYRRVLQDSAKAF